MVSKRFLLTFAFVGLLMLNLITTACAASINYTLGVRSNDEYIWEVKTVHEYGIKKIFGSYDLKYSQYHIGAKMKIIIREIEITKNEEWLIFCDAWAFTKYEFNIKPDIESTYFLFKMDPAKYEGNYERPFYPIPTAAYLEKAFGTKKDFEIDGTKLTLKYDDYKEDFYYSTSNGVLTSCKYILTNGTVIYEYSLVDIIPGYEISIFIGTMGIFIIGIIVFQTKIYKLIKK